MATEKKAVDPEPITGNPVVKALLVHKDKIKNPAISALVERWFKAVQELAEGERTIDQAEKNLQQLRSMMQNKVGHLAGLEDSIAEVNNFEPPVSGQPGATLKELKERKETSS
jgi:hypothetical protein